MTKIRKIPVSHTEFQYHFVCPGCDQEHAFNDKTWEWNEDFEKPTLSPSYLIQGRRGSGKDYENFVCHSFIKNGMIQFLNDCTHKLAGQTVELPENNL